MKKIITVMLVILCLVFSGCASMSHIETEAKTLGEVMLDDALVIGFGFMMGACFYEEIK